ncbi:hypothetical protein EDB84DRAFT_1281635 [Lactarius hengduanensis]|nr:hypothetical protein EDB84DRAFT_1281635 [Lactarius hengduanensis]
MPRIIEDPTRAVCPSFESAEWEFLRNSMIDAHQGLPPLTQDQATQRLKDTWARENGAKVTAWNAQLEQDRIDQEELDRLAQEEVDARLAQQLKEAEEQRKEAERKKPKLNPFDPERVISDWIEPRPAPYAINKLNSLEYIELDYFTVKGCNEASADTNKSISHDTLAFTQIDDTITMRPLAAIKPSRSIRNDEDLSWEEMLQAKNTMLHFMAKSAVWPEGHARALAAFFVALELHPRVLQTNGKGALLLYQSRARREWFEALKRNEGFNIERIGEGLLRACAEAVDRKVRDTEFDQVRNHTHRADYHTRANLALTLPPPPPSPPQTSTHNSPSRASALLQTRHLPLPTPTMPCHAIANCFCHALSSRPFRRPPPAPPVGYPATPCRRRHHHVVHPLPPHPNTRIRP